MRKKTKVLYSSTAIEEAVANLGHGIAEDYKDKTPIVVGVLSGSFIFMADLVREIGIDVEINFINAASYTDNKKVGAPTITGGPKHIQERDVILVDEICETGDTLKVLREYFIALGAKSVKSCTLVVRPESQDQVDYYGFVIDKKHWLIGYGMDDCKLSRNLPHLYTFVNDEETDR